MSAFYRRNRKVKSSQSSDNQEPAEVDIEPLELDSGTEEKTKLKKSLHW